MTLTTPSKEERLADLLAGGAFLHGQGNARRPEALSRRPCHREPRTPSRVSSVAEFSQGEVRHECTKQTLARLRPGGTGGPGRGYERSRVARTEHLNSLAPGRCGLSMRNTGPPEAFPRWPPALQPRHTFRPVA